MKLRPSQSMLPIPVAWEPQHAGESAFKLGRITITPKALGSIVVVMERKGETLPDLDNDTMTWQEHIATYLPEALPWIAGMLRLHIKGLCQCGRGACVTRNMLHAQQGGAITTGQYIGEKPTGNTQEMWRVFWIQTDPQRTSTQIVRSDEILWDDAELDPLELELGHGERHESYSHAYSQFDA